MKLSEPIITKPTVRAALLITAISTSSARLVYRQQEMEPPWFEPWAESQSDCADFAATSGELQASAQATAEDRFCIFQTASDELCRETPGRFAKSAPRSERIRPINPQRTRSGSTVSLNGFYRSQTSHRKGD